VDVVETRTEWMTSSKAEPPEKVIWMLAKDNLYNGVRI
jgi:hypothetical protein